MKIGLITHYMPPHNGGIERVAEMLFTAYTTRGFEVRWLASRDPGDTPPREGDRIRVPCWNGLECRLGVPVPLWGPWAWAEVRRLAHWADVLHVHDCLYPGSVLAAVLGPSLGTPVLLTQHVGFIQYRAAALRIIERLAFATLGRWVLGRACRLAFATPAAEAYVSQLLGGYPGHACTIPNGVDTDRFHPASQQERQSARRTLGLLDDAPVVLFVGRLVEKKGVNLVIETSRQLRDVQFLIIGDGPLARIVPDEPNIRWYRSMSPEQIHECYHASDCFLLPSHGEGLPVAVQEAAACGLPMVVSEGEIYTGPLSDHGICFSAPRTPEALTRRVREALVGGTAEMSARARRHAESDWSLRAMATRYIALLEAAAAKREGVQR
jgi:glycosyltransferase involved in cell wall biosynthesis